MRLPTWFSSAFLVSAWLACTFGASAQGFPARPVRLVVANTPGSAPDVLARYLGTRLAETWKQPVVVENRAGAAGILAADLVAKAPADGQTLLVGADGPITILPNLQTALPYDAARDLVPVVSLGEIDFVLVANPKTGFHSLQDFIAAARAHPGRYNYASAGNGSPQQFGMELLKQQAGLFVTHIPYRGGPLGLADVVAGQVDVMFIAIGPALPQIRSGRLVALATSGEVRHPLLPELPTVAERFPGFKAGTWFGLFAPAHTPQTVVDEIAREVGRVVTNPTTRADLAAQGIDTTGYPQQKFQGLVTAESQRVAQLVKRAGIKAE